MTSLTIWADYDPPPANSGPVALWQAFLLDDALEDWFQCRTRCTVIERPAD